MQLLKDRIKKEGKVLSEHILKVDGFLNHQIDVALLNEIGKEFKKRFERQHVTKILTIEASGISVACITAQYFNVPVLFAKKNKTKNIADDLFSTKVASYTHGNTYDVVVSKKFLHPEDSILIIDDFLANGCAVEGLIDLVKAAGAKLSGVGIVIEKGFQRGGAVIREQGIMLESLAIIEKMDSNGILFR